MHVKISSKAKTTDFVVFIANKFLIFFSPVRIIFIFYFLQLKKNQTENGSTRYPSSPP